MPRSLFFVALLTTAVALTLPPVRTAGARPVEAAAVKIDPKTLLQAAALAPVLAATPASAFTADYLPAILVPVMTLFMPLVGMALGFILVEKQE